MLRLIRGENSGQWTENFQELSFSKEEIEKALTNCGLSLNIRGEALTLEKFAELANSFYDLKNE